MMVYVYRDDGKENGNYGCVCTGVIRKKMDITML